MKILSKTDKLAVLQYTKQRIIADTSNVWPYLCSEIRDTIELFGYWDQFDDGDAIHFTDVATHFIPEMRQLKPADIGNESTAWWELGNTYEEHRDIRLAKLDELIQIIKNLPE